jgi:hypothetical protein
MVSDCSADAGGRRAGTPTVIARRRYSLCQAGPAQPTETGCSVASVQRTEGEDDEDDKGIVEPRVEGAIARNTTM